MDPNIAHNEALEWLIMTSENVKVVGLMLREVGVRASCEVFGPLAAQVVENPTRGPEYCWTELLQTALRSGGYVVDKGKIYVGASSAEWFLNDFLAKNEAYDVGQSIHSEAFDLPQVGVSDARLKLDKSQQDKLLTLVTITHRLCKPVWTEVSSGGKSTRSLSGCGILGFARELDDRSGNQRDEISIVARWYHSDVDSESLDLKVSGQVATWHIDPKVVDTNCLLPATCIYSSRGMPMIVDGIELTCALLFFPGGRARKVEHCSVVVQVFFDSAPVRRIEYTGSIGNVKFPKMCAGGPTADRTLQFELVKQHDLASFLKLQDPVITVEILSAA